MWFKVDDNYWSHPKVMFQSLGATALWVRAGSWTANHLTDGRVPIKITHMIIPKRPAAIDALGDELESVGMWYRDGDEWVFHDWQDYQPTRAKVEAERERSRERQDKWRQRLSRRDNGVSNGVTNTGPTRPDPTRPSTYGGPIGPPAISTSVPEPPCEHGSEPRLCALCRLRRDRETQ